MGKRILVFGEMCREISLNGNGDINDDIIYADNFDNAPGGNGTNVAAALACYGFDTVICSVVGNDSDGLAVTKYFSSMSFNEGNLSVQFVDRKSGLRTPLSISVNTPNGTKKVVCRSEDYGIGKLDVADAYPCYHNVTVVTDSMTSEGFCELAKQMKQKPTALYIMGCENAERLSAIGKCTVISLSYEQAKKIYGKDFYDQQACAEVCNKISNYVTTKAIIIRMSTGYYVSDGYFCSFYPAFDFPTADIEYADPIFCASFVNAFSKSEGDLDYAAKFAKSAVGFYISNDKNDFPTDELVKRFAEKNGVKL